MPTFNMMAGIGFFVLGHVFMWFQLNSQFAWNWWRDKPFLAVGIYSIPVGLCFWYATKLIFEETGAAWSGRFVGFSASYFVFPILTWVLLHESMLTAKTLTCVFLSCLILAVQLFWK